VTVAVYRVTHTTEYRYGSPVEESYGQLYVLPRDTASQRCRRTVVDIEPKPDDYHERVDHFGNRAAYFAVLRPHTVLRLAASSTIDVEPTAPAGGGPTWEAVRDALAPDDRQFALESPLVPRLDELADYAAASFTAGRPIVEAVADLSARIHRDFAYEPGATSVSTTLAEVLNQRRGVCQDFAHLGIGCLRSLGLAARYVSGYLETVPPPGRARLVGADVSHAWFGFHAGPLGWVDVDPTNDQFVAGHHLTNAWGRDYHDVPPVKGVIFTDAASNELSVTVDVVPAG
jgi:transglutaminase-like putative cysteine protease